MPRSVARVQTVTPERYAKQLVSHLGRRVPVSGDAATDGARLTFDVGVGVVRTGQDELVLVADAPTNAGLAVVQDVLSRHLVRFGERHGLTVTWSDPAGAGSAADSPPGASA